MIKNNKACPCHPITIPEDREICNTDDKTYEWKMDPKGYFLVKLGEGKEEGLICCGWVNSEHKMEWELRGKDVHKMIKEIAKRNPCSQENLGYIAQELMLAKDCLDNNKSYVQR
ncbi:MAG: hypothetical protein KKG59_02200 [Nanoarchaeota archaeon]|nr:hypothetical protein [Nanoarchaeota archaeon]